jgi:hypothetical protein
MTADLTNEKRLKIAKTLFYAGWGCLPILWIYNVFIFSPMVWRKYPLPPAPPHLSTDTASSLHQEPFLSNDEVLALRRVIIHSLIAGVLSILCIVSWYVIYATQRHSWREFGDQLSLIIPKGS